MRKRVHQILVTGAAGFIGSAFVRRAARENYRLIALDKLTYAGDLRRLEDVKGKYKFYKADIRSRAQIETIFEKEKPTILVNFAASTHVDRSILNSRDFVETNVIGTHVLLDASRKYEIKTLFHISSDEVYGEIKKGKFSETSALKPNSPYAASKAGGDLLIRSYIRTYGFPAIIIRPCNNYGPWQYPEKLIPLAILKILSNKKIPLYGDGRNVREWLYVDDCVEGILKIIEKGRVGEIYNLGSAEQKRNIKVVKALLQVFKRDESLIEFVKDRPGHDTRYSLNSSKVKDEIGWQPKVNFSQGLRAIAEWSCRHQEWLLSKWKNISSLYK